MNFFSKTAKTPFFSEQEKTGLDPKAIPNHVAIIPDGNRRWAKANSVPTAIAHKQGAENMIEILRAAKELGIKTLSFYGFSTENWNRSSTEVSLLFRLIALYIRNQVEEMLQEGVRLEVIGEIAALPSFLQEEIASAKEKTERCHEVTLVLALNYGARDEIKRAFHTLLQEVEAGMIQKEQIDEKMIAERLDTAFCGDPELLIRTSGESRLSNFLLWQSSYTEIVVSPKLWPDFTPQCLYEAVLDYQQRNRRWGE